MNQRDTAYLEQAANADGSNEREQNPLRTSSEESVIAPRYVSTQKTYTFERSSSVVMMPNPTIMITQETHIMGRHLPQREMICPETTDIRAPDKENGSILGGKVRHFFLKLLR